MGNHQLDKELNIEIKILNDEIEENLKMKYIFSSAHRRTQKDKTRWTVSTHTEIDCFKNTQTSKYLEGDEVAWGCLKTTSGLIDLGINGHKENLKIAKFVDKNKLKIWHGYPADFVRNPQDRPSVSVLKKWRTGDIIEKHHITKIRQGKTCNL